jgi:hypothetical protein
MKLMVGDVASFYLARADYGWRIVNRALGTATGCESPED